MDVLGVGVSAINLAVALREIDSWVAHRFHSYVCVTGVHGIIESYRDASLRAIHNSAGMVTPDGMPLVWINWLFGQRHVDRVYGPDLMLAVCQNGIERGYRHFLYGGGEGVPELLAERLRILFPKIQIVGAVSPPFRALTPEEEKEVIHQMNASRADIVWIGLSTPKQERWMAQFRSKLDAPALIGVGAAFDFHAGLKRQAPPWMQRSGLEWLFRLSTEPRRLWKRYLINNPLFVLLFLRQVTRRIWRRLDLSQSH